MKQESEHGHFSPHAAAGFSQLTVRITTATVLTQSDAFGGLPDPYVEVTAIDCNGRRHVMRTTTKDDTRNPVWNEVLNFGFNCWLRFEIRLYDEDLFFDDLVLEDSRVVVGFGGNIQLNSTLCLEQGALCNATVEFGYGNIFSTGM